MDNTPPAWVNRFRTAFGSSQAFILHMNVRDYVIPGILLTSYLVQLFGDWELVVIYNRSQGIRFPLPSMQETALDLLGLNRPQAPNPLEALGMAPAPPPGPASLPSAPSQALPLLETLLKSNAVRVAVIIEFAETIMPAADLTTMSPDDRTALVTLARWGTDPDIAASDNVALLLTQNLADLHPTLRSAASLYAAIEIPLPDLVARQTFIEFSIQARPEVQLALPPDQMARMTAGLSLIHIENIFMQAEASGALTVDTVRALKTALIETEYAGLLEVLEPAYGFESIGGMDALKQWAEREIIRPAQDGRTQDMPQGVVLVGPPGTGKTYFVRGLAKEIGFNAVALSMENILGGIVGTSERNLARALAVVRSLSPVLVFMDELDQSDVSARGQSSGNPVAKNLFNMLLRFLSDPGNRGRVIFFGASNRPDLMDPALLRFGRIDAIVPVLLPEEPDRAAIARAAARSQAIGLADEVAGHLAANTDKYAASDIAAVVTKARKLARHAGADAIGLDHATAALATLRPATLKRADYFTLLAVEACNDTDLLPARYAALLDDRTTLDQQISDQRPDTPTPRRRREI